MKTLQWVLLWLTLGCVMGCQAPSIEGIANCANPQQPMEKGLLDLKTRDNYNARILFPEGASFQVIEVKVWFEYPTPFSRSSLGTQLLKSQENPLMIPAVGVYRGSDKKQSLLITIVPTELTRMWFDALEFRTGNQRFTVQMHIKVAGDYELAEFVYPLEVCKGCLERSDSTDCKTKTKPDDQGKSGMHCIGQDGICRSNE